MAHFEKLLFCYRVGTEAVKAVKTIKSVFLQIEL